MNACCGNPAKQRKVKPGGLRERDPNLPPPRSLFDGPPSPRAAAAAAEIDADPEAEPVPEWPKVREQQRVQPPASPHRLL